MRSLVIIDYVPGGIAEKFGRIDIIEWWIWGGGRWGGGRWGSRIFEEAFNEGSSGLYPSTDNNNNNNNINNTIGINILVQTLSSIG